MRRKGSQARRSTGSGDSDSRPFIYVASFLKFSFSFVIVDHMAPGACMEAQKGNRLVRGGFPRRPPAATYTRIHPSQTKLTFNTPAFFPRCWRRLVAVAFPSSGNILRQEQPEPESESGSHPQNEIKRHIHFYRRRAHGEVFSDLPAPRLLSTGRAHGSCLRRHVTGFRASGCRTRLGVPSITPTIWHFIPQISNITRIIAVGKEVILDPVHLAARTRIPKNKLIRWRTFRDKLCKSICGLGP